MRRLVHISDLHFGRIDYKTVISIEKAICRIQPDLVAVSGDLTQRARPEQYQEAKAFLDRLPFTKIVVAGNHDVPLYNVFLRFLFPRVRWHHYIGESNPIYEDEEMLVVGIDTTRSWTFKDGIVKDAPFVRLRDRLAQTTGKIRIVVSHHPLPRLALAFPDMLLAGHLHAGTATTKDGMIFVQSGTSTSTRLRDEGNTFNVIEIEKGHVRVEKYSYDSSQDDFVKLATFQFRREENGWATS